MNATTKTLQQLQEEAAAAQAALQAAQQAELEAKEAAERAEREARRQQELERERSLVAARRAAMQQQLAKVGVTLDDLGNCGHARLGHEEITERLSRWRSRGTGRYRIVVCCTDYHMNFNDRRFPPTKTGYSWEKIADYVNEINDAVAARQFRETERQRLENAARAAADAAKNQALAKTAEAARYVTVEGAYDVSGHDYRGRWHSNKYIASAGKVFVSMPHYEVRPDQAAQIAEAVARIMAQKEV